MDDAEDKKAKNENLPGSKGQFGENNATEEFRRLPDPPPAPASAPDEQEPSGRS